MFPSAPGAGPASGTDLLIASRKLAPAALSGDRKGILIAVLCFIHCVAGPVILSFAGFASLVGFAEKLEPLFFLSSVALGATTLVPGYRKKHGRFLCLALFSCGLFCLLVLRHIRWTAVQEIITVTIGAGLIMGAHALNLKFCKECECCTREDAERSRVAS